MRLLRDCQHHRKFLPPWSESISYETKPLQQTDITAGTSALKYYAECPQCVLMPFVLSGLFFHF
jgi:hypothetical protein